MKRFVFAAIAAVTMSALPLARNAGAMQHGSGGHEMSMHHQHILMGHGLSMVLEGSNMVMLGQMNMVAALDPMSVEHGKMMISNGKGLIERALSGPEMMAMHKEGKSPKDDPMMKATHDLGESFLKMTGLVEKMEMGGEGEHSMAMHHMHGSPICPAKESPCPRTWPWSGAWTWPAPSIPPRWSMERR